MTVATAVDLGSQRLATPLVAASGTVGSVWEFARVADVSAYGAMTAKSVSEEPWPGRARRGSLPPARDAECDRHPEPRHRRLGETARG